MARIGALDERVTLQAYTQVADGGGGFTKTWANLASVPTVWAHVKPASGREALEDGRTNAESLNVFTIRNRSDIDEKTRIVWRGDNYNIRQIKRASRREMYLEIVAEFGAAN